MKLGMCMCCGKIFTIVDAVVNVKEEDKVRATFDCTNCGAVTRIDQTLVSKPNRSFKDMSKLHI
jgi:hypothetical protein